MIPCALIFPPLLAAAGDWLQFLIPIVMFLVFIINRLLGGEAPKNQGKPQAARPKPPQPPKPERKRVEDEVGEFLRRAAQQRAGAKENRVEAPLTARPAAQRERQKPLAAAMPSGRAETGQVVVELVDEDAPPRRVTDTPVELSQLRSREFTSRESEVAHADEDMEEHLKQVFDHRVGDLAGAAPSAQATPGAADTEAPAAERIARMLSDPASVGQAIILSEVLRRPVDRW